MLLCDVPINGAFGHVICYIYIGQFDQSFGLIRVFSTHLAGSLCLSQSINQFISVKARDEVALLIRARS